MKRSFKSLLAAVMLLAVMCAGAAFASDPVTVDLKVGAQLKTGAITTNDAPSPLPNNELRLWVTRGVGSIPKQAKLVDAKGNPIHSWLILYSTKPTIDAAGEWLTERVQGAYATELKGSGVIGNRISYKVDRVDLTLSADVDARSGDKATVYVYGGLSDDKGQKVTSVQNKVPDGRVFKYFNVEPFPTAEISFTDTNKNGAAFTSFDIVVLSSDADLILDQIAPDPELELAEGSNIVVKDAEGAITDVVPSSVSQRPLITVELAGNGSEIVVVSADAYGNIDSRYTWSIDANDARAYLKDDGTTICTFTPVIDPSGTITYRMDDPGLLQVLKDRLGKELTIDFADLNTTHGMKLPVCLVKFTLSLGGRGSSGSCAAGAAAFVAIAALAAIRRRSR